MAVAYSAHAWAHTQGGPWSTSQASFTWNHTPSGTPRGILIFTYSDDSTNLVTSCTYGGVNVPAVSGGVASDTAGEKSTVAAWFLGSGVPTGTQAVVVNR